MVRARVLREVTELRRSHPPAVQFEMTAAGYVHAHRCMEELDRIRGFALGLAGNPWLDH
jgi:hypothetical protein